jgi:hypothetical protein
MRANAEYQVGQTHAGSILLRPVHVKGRRNWECQCLTCGHVRVLTTDQLRANRSGKCKQCQRVTHGQTKSLAHVSWSEMHTRCGNPRRKTWQYYGGRGIKVCDRWRSFENFLADMGERPEGRTLDRIDTDGDYTPINCRWATHREQANNRSNKRLVNDTETVAQYARRVGISYSGAYERFFGRADGR